MTYENLEVWSKMDKFYLSGIATQNLQLKSQI